MASPDLYRIHVAVETYEDAGYEGVDGYGRAQWDADVHRSIEVKAFLTPSSVRHHDTVEALRQHDPNDLHRAFTWAAGVLGRLILVLDEEVARIEAKDGHRCDTDQQGQACGVTYREGITWGSHGSPRWAVSNTPPWFNVYVPTEHADTWADRIRRHLGTMLTEDQTPLPDRTTTREDGHVAVTITAPTDTTTRSIK